MRITNQAIAGPFAKALLSAAALAATSIFALPTAAQDVTEAIAQAASVPQIDAFLPDKYSVEETEALPIDGVWMISSINKKIRIERGRAYAVDSWLHMFTLKVQPDMVVLQNFQRTGPGQYTADDLPLLGPATFQLRPDGNISVKVKGMLGPVGYNLIKRDIDDNYALQAEFSAMNVGGGSPNTDYDDRPAYDDDDDSSPDADPLANCEMLDIDPATGDVVCMD